MHYQSQRRQGRLPLARLKRCPLCDSINARANRECFVCGWAGKFDHDLQAIAEAMDFLVEQCPDIYPDVMPYSFPRLTVRDQARALWARVRRRLDIRA